MCWEGQRAETVPNTIARRHDRGRGQIRSRTRGQVHPLLSEQVESLRGVLALAADIGRAAVGGGSPEADLCAAEDRDIATVSPRTGNPFLPPYREQEEPEPDLRQQVVRPDRANPQGPPRVSSLQLHDAAGYGCRSDSSHRRG